MLLFIHYCLKVYFDALQLIITGKFQQYLVNSRIPWITIILCLLFLQNFIATNLTIVWNFPIPERTIINFNRIYLIQMIVLSIQPSVFGVPLIQQPLRVSNHPLAFTHRRIPCYSSFIIWKLYNKLFWAKTVKKRDMIPFLIYLCFVKPHQNWFIMFECDNLEKIFSALSVFKQLISKRDINLTWLSGKTAICAKFKEVGYDGSWKILKDKKEIFSLQGQPQRSY